MLLQDAHRLPWNVPGKNVFLRVPPVPYQKGPLRGWPRFHIISIIQWSTYSVNVANKSASTSVKTCKSFIRNNKRLTSEENWVSKSVCCPWTLWTEPLINYAAWFSFLIKFTVSYFSLFLAGMVAWASNFGKLNTKLSIIFSLFYLIYTLLQRIHGNVPCPGGVSHTFAFPKVKIFAALGSTVNVVLDLRWWHEGSQWPPKNFVFCAVETR